MDRRAKILSNGVDPPPITCAVAHADTATSSVRLWAVVHTDSDHMGERFLQLRLLRY